MVVISERSIEKIVLDVAPKVERLTGWSCHLDSLNVKLINRSQYWEQAIKPMYEHLGIETTPKTEKGKNALNLLQTIIPYIILGQYQPATESLLIMPANMRFGTNESGLAKTIGHELVHRCQFSNNEDFFEKYKQLVRKTAGINALDDDEFEDKRAEKPLQKQMTLIEGDASFVEGQLKKMFYQDAKNKMCWASNAIGLLVSVQALVEGGSMLEKIKQYTKGKKMVEDIYSVGGRLGVNQLYKQHSRISLF